MKLSVSEAARAAGVSKATISRHVKNGRISCVRGGSGHPEIDASELLRYYPGADLEQRHLAQQPQERTETPRQNVSRNNALRGELEAIRAERDRLLKDVEQERAEKARILDLLETAQRQITDQRPAPGLWKRIFG